MGGGLAWSPTHSSHQGETRHVRAFPRPPAVQPLQHLFHSPFRRCHLATLALTWVLQVPTRLYILALYPKPQEGRGHLHLHSELLGVTEAPHPSLRMAALLLSPIPAQIRRVGSVRRAELGHEPLTCSCYVIAVSSWGSTVASWRLGFLICEMGAR